MALCLKAKRAQSLLIDSHSLLLWEALTGCTVQLKHLSRAVGPGLMLAIPAQANGVCGEAVSHSILLFDTVGCKVGGAAQAALAICLHRSHRILSDPLGSSLLPQL